jgi:hypothetical protein
MPDTVIAILIICTVLAYGAVAWAVITKFRSTHNTGFLVLGLGVLGWPLLSWLFGITGWSILEDQLVSLAIRAGLTVGEVVVVVAMASRLAQGGMILIGILLIGRAQNGRTSDVAHRPAEA